MSINCAIDGPSGAGKSTIARAVAKKLGYIYVDTGALYRAVGLHAVRNGKDTKSAAEIAPLLSDLRIELKYNGSEQSVLLNGEDVSSLIRTNEISMAASNVSAIPEVRSFLLSLQRDIAANNNIVMDGRDIGTVILPDADVKIFMTASCEVRAQRRFKELCEMGQSVTYEQVLGDIIQRDENDSTRKTAPLKQADDAVYLDNSEMTIEQACDAICGIIEQKTGGFRTKKRRFGKLRLFIYRILRFLASLILWFVASVKYEGLENIPKEGNYIVAPNHVTWFDPVAVALKLPNISAYIAKEEIFKSKFSILLKPFHVFPVKRGQGDKGAIEVAENYLNLGYNLTIFPEGTRSKDGKLGKGKSGIVVISSATRSDVLPVGITVRKKGKRTKMTVKYGRMIPFDELKTDSLSPGEIRAARDMIMQRIGELVDYD